MTTPRSARSTANHFQDHLDDERVREDLRDQLIGARRATGLDSAALSRRVGHYEDWLYRLEQKSDSRTWKFNSISDWGRAVGLDVWVHPVIHPVLPENKIGPMARAGVTMAPFSGVGFMEYARDWRVFHGIEQKELAARLDVVHSTMWAIEESDNPRISTMQRYIRALGGELEFHLESRPLEPGGPF